MRETQEQQAERMMRSIRRTLLWNGSAVCILLPLLIEFADNGWTWYQKLPYILVGELAGAYMIRQSRTFSFKSVENFGLRLRAWLLRKRRDDHPDQGTPPAQ